MLRDGSHLLGQGRGVGGKEEGDTHSSSETAQELAETLQNGIRILAFKAELRI